MRRAAITCPRCDGTREEPGVPADDRDGLALCNLCGGSGVVPAPKPTWQTCRQAIVTKYHGPTNTRGSRYSATCAAGRIYAPADDSLNYEDNHRIAATMLFEKLDWRRPDWELIGGGLPDGRFAWVQVSRAEFNEGGGQ